MKNKSFQYFFSETVREKLLTLSSQSSFFEIKMKLLQQVMENNDFWFFGEHKDTQLCSFTDIPSFTVIKISVAKLLKIDNLYKNNNTPSVSYFF